MFEITATTIAIWVAMGLAALTQSIAGFGFALTAMPILASATSLELATPLVAVAGFFNGTIMWLTYRQTFEMKAILRLLGASLLSIPIGLYGLQYVPESAALFVLGIIVGGYALYSLASVELPKLTSNTWGYGFGMIAGVLTGSFNTPGPAVVFYGQCRRWLPDEFKSNLAGFFWFNSVAVVIGHTVQHHLSSELLGQLAIAAPIILLGFGIGTLISRTIDPETFRKIVLSLLVITGCRLTWMGVQPLLFATAQ
ncbi:MAG: sulfite exporter TauE/SafE family protein [Cyanobacteria bacterium J06627_8]